MTPDRRGLTHRWTVPQATSGSDLPLIDRVLDARGYSDPQARAAFLKGSLMDLPEPDTLPGCTQAAGLVLQAIKNNTPITIYGDFDVDGVTATAMLLHLIRTMAPQADVDWHIPHRIDEGYGLNADALTTIAATRKGLVITVDCGVTAIEEAALAAELGLTLIITDHHTIGPDDPLPQAAAIVHPGLPNDPYPFRDLAGAGVAWKLALCMAQQFVGGPTLTQDLRQVILDGLTLAAFGTVADVMPLHGENRHIVTVGLRHVSQCSLPGVHALVQACTKPGEKVAAETVGFRIGPRLNAAGRLGHARDALEVLLTKDEDQARTIAEALAACNVKRQDMVRTLVAVAQDQATANGMTSPDTRMIVLAGDDDIWHRGVLGITCSRLAEQFRRPTILLRREDDLYVGSCRSIDSFNMYDALQQCDDLLARWGGHPMAAGLSVPAANLHAFTERITAWANSYITEDDLIPHIQADCVAIRGDLNLDSITALDTMAPFGRGNRRPCMVIEGATIRTARLFGKGDSPHVGLKLDAGDVAHRFDNGVEANSLVDAVWWRAAEHIDDLHEGVRVDAIGTVAIDDFTQGVRLSITDIRVLD